MPEFSAARTGPTQSGQRWLLWWWQWQGLWRQQRGRALIAILAVAIGVALGAAVHLVNASALDEFGRALAVVNGDAQWQVMPTRGSFDESLYAKLASDEGRSAGVVAVSPLIDIRVSAMARDGDAGNDRPLRVVGIDLYRAARVTPALIPRVDPRVNEGGSASPLFGDDTVFLSAAAQRLLSLQPGDTLKLRGPRGPVALRVAGDIASGGAADSGPALAVLDIGALQWHLDWIGQLNRLDLRVRDGIDEAALTAALAPLLGQDARLQRPDASGQRMSNLSRAYRVNLGVLSLVALFTGTLIVYATLALSVTRQRISLAMLGVIGMSRRQIQALVLGQGVLLGVIGASLGLASGMALARLFLSRVGGDLGGGYFSDTLPTLSWSAAALSGYWLAGVATGALGSWWPMRSLDRQPIIARLRGAEAQLPTSQRYPWRWPLLWLVIGLALLQLPSIAGLPLAAYAAIAAWLFAGITAIPALVTALSRLLSRFSPGWPPLWLACQHLGAARLTAAGTLSGVVASFALASAMAIMVTSFRGSVEHWLDQVLPADLYTRAAGSGAQGAFAPRLIDELLALPGIERVVLTRASELTLDASRPAVAILARPIERDRPSASLPIAGAVAPDTTSSAGGERPVSIYVSEAMLDLYQMHPGQLVELPLGPASTRFLVRAVWRDYARQFGAIAIDEADYARLTGDTSKTDVAVWLRRDVAPDQALVTISQALPSLADLPWRSASELRALSLTIFDRSFAITYLLEAIALGVGLFGVAATFAGESLARSREFGLLRQLGVTRLSLGLQLAVEAALLLCCGVAWGLLIGIAIAWVLVDRVNPQSFHWTMDIAYPVPLLALSALVLVVVGTLTAAIASRQAASQSPVRAVRADW